MAQLGKGKNEMIRFRYKAMHDRITKFDFD